MTSREVNIPLMETQWQQLFPSHSQVLGDESFQGGAAHPCLDSTFWDWQSWTWDGSGLGGFALQGEMLELAAIPVLGAANFHLMRMVRCYERSGLKHKWRKGEPSSGVSAVGGVALASATSGVLGCSIQGSCIPEGSSCPPCLIWDPTAATQAAPENPKTSWAGRDPQEHPV